MSQVKINPKGSGRRKTSVRTTSLIKPSVGMQFTIAGTGWGAKGQEVFGDWNPKTKRRCRCVRLRTYVVTREITE